MVARRRVDAAHNDERILDAARAVFAEQGADAPVAAIARRAGTGIGSLYRRYPSKEALLRELLLATIEDTRRRAEQALEVPDAWSALRDFVLDCAESGGMPTDPGPLTITDEVLDASRRAREAVQVLLDRAQAGGSVRSDVNAHDVVMILTELRRIRSTRGGKHPGPAYPRFDRIVVAGLRANPDLEGDLGPSPIDWGQVRDAWVAGGRGSADHGVEDGGDPAP